MKDLLPLGCWAAEDRPTEKMENIGGRGLSASELVSIVIGKGRESNPVEVARRLLAKYDNDLRRIANLSVSELTEIGGIGEATAKVILASLELGRKAFTGEVKQKKVMDSAAEIYSEMKPVLSNLPVEEFWALLLNQRYGLIKKVLIGRGGISEVAADIRLVVKEALLVNAPLIAVCHNHPSGNANPSKVDDTLTTNLQKACDTMRLHFVDHVVVTDYGYYSYRENGRL